MRTRWLLRGLADAFDVTLVTFRPDPDGPHPRAHEELAELMPEVEVRTVARRSEPAKRAGQLLGLASRRSWAFGRLVTPGFRRELHRAVVERRPALIHFDDLGVALAGPIAGPLNAYSAHNVEVKLAQRAALVSTGPRKLFAEVEMRRIGREEAGVWRAMDLCVAISDVDAAAMRQGGARQVEIALVGTEEAALRPPPVRATDEPLRLVFVGVGSYHPNEHGLAWFIERVLPKVRASLPAELEVVGPLPNRPLSGPGVRYAGPVPSLATHYETAHAAIIPIHYGSGARGKVVEAMSYGRPVVSTGLGVEGLAVEPGRHYIRADDEDAFARGLVDLGRAMESPSGRLGGMLDAGRALAERHFFPHVARSLAEHYTRALGADLAPSPDHPREPPAGPRSP